MDGDRGRGLPAQVEIPVTYFVAVPGNPVPKERPRFNGRIAYTPKKTRDAEDWIRAHCNRLPCLTGPLKLRIAFFRKDAQPCDLDNLAKLVQDALNGRAFKDDRQIVVLAASKEIDRKRPRTEIEIEEIA